MNLIQKDRAFSALMDRYESEDGKIEMGIARMLYGFRVRCGYVDDNAYFCDWCCGDNLLTVGISVGLMKRFLEKDVHKQLPGFSMIKPWTKDEEFMAKIQKVADDIGEVVNIEEIAKILNPLK